MASATPNTHNTTAHGFTDRYGNPIAPTLVNIAPRARNLTTVAETVIAHVVSFDATNVIWKSNIASAVVDLTLLYAADFQTFPG